MCACGEPASNRKHAVHTCATWPRPRPAPLCAGENFGYPYCHTSPAGGNFDSTPYLRAPGIGPNVPDPDLNADESVVKCNRAPLPFRPPLQAFGPHVAPLGMVRLPWGGCEAGCSACVGHPPATHWHPHPPASLCPPTNARLQRFFKWRTGSNFPREFDNAIFVAQHGSWNRGRGIGAR